MTLKPGTSVERYIIQGVIGEGAMAVVYQAKHRDLGSMHALKQLTRPDAEVRERLVQEGRLQSTLSHPNVVSVTDLVEVAGMPALVMEYIAGPTLQQLLKKGPLSMEQIDALASGILRGVAAAHAHGLVHRDLKPGNILVSLTNDALVPKIADFGLAKVLAQGGEGLLATQTGSSMGTPAYMAPEQIQDSSTVDARADIFALGAILYELVTGARCFEGQKVIPLWRNICAGKYTAITERQPDAPERMVRAIDGALRTEPDERIQDVDSLLSTWFEGPEGGPSISVIDSADLWPQTVREEIQALASSPTKPDTAALSDTLGLAHTMAEGAPPAPISGSMSPDLKPELETQPNRPSRTGWLVGGLLLLLLLTVAITWVLKPTTPDPTAQHRSPPQANVEVSPEVAPTPVPPAERLIHLDAVTEAASLRRFEAAKAAIAQGEFPRAERLLDTLLKAHPKAAMPHSLRSLTRFFLHKDDLSMQDSAAAALLARDLTTPQGQLLRLTDRSWREHDNADALLTQWTALREVHHDPVLTLLYLTGARYLIAPAAHAAALNQAKERYPEVVALWLLELRLLEARSAPKQVLEAAQEAARIHPASSAIQLVRYEAMVELGQYEDAERGLKSVLVQDGSLVGARMALADLYLVTDRESERMSAMMHILSDTTAVSDQLRFLEHHASIMANRGRLKDATKLWDFCMRIGVDERFFVRSASCGMSALTALAWFEIHDESAAWHIRMSEVLDQPELDASARTLHRLLLLWNTTWSAMQTDPTKVAGAHALVARVEAFSEGTLPFGLKRWLLSRIRFELALVEGDVPQLRGQLAKLLASAKAAHGALTCEVLDAQTRAGVVLKDEAFVTEAVDLILKGACVPHANLGIQQAKARTMAIKAYTVRGEEARAKALLGEFWAAWPNADESLSLVAWAKRLEAAP
ncbi:MAG: protein kinase domain-containing protein [Myxococcota bacterium]